MFVVKMDDGCVCSNSKCRGEQILEANGFSSCPLLHTHTQTNAIQTSHPHHHHHHHTHNHTAATDQLEQKRALDNFLFSSTQHHGKYPHTHTQSHRKKEACPTIFITHTHIINAGGRPIQYQSQLGAPPEQVCGHGPP